MGHGMLFSVCAAPLLALGCSERGDDPVPVEPYVLTGINFSPYVDGQDPTLGTVVSYDQMWERMLLVEQDAEWIRTFSVTHGLETAGEIAHQLGKKAAVGAWLGPDQEANAIEVAALVELAQAGDVDLAIVGSEVLLRGDLTLEELLAHVQVVRAQIPATIPVSSAEIYPIYLAEPELMDAVDVALVNYYPYWSGVPIEDAVARLHCWHAAVQAAADGKQVIVSETGWPSAGDPVGAALPTPQNAAWYFQEFTSWAREQEVFFFYFAALDEEWKALYEGPQGAHWGIRDKQGLLKPGMNKVFQGYTVAGNWQFDPLPGGPGTAQIELTFVPPLGSLQDLVGQIWHVNPPSYRVAVYIRVDGGWWTKPYWSTPLTVVDCAGSWVCDITTGGHDETADRIAAFLLPVGVEAPAMSGGGELPSSLYENSVAYVVVDR